MVAVGNRIPLKRKNPAACWTACSGRIHPRPPSPPLLPNSGADAHADSRSNLGCNGHGRYHGRKVGVSSELEVDGVEVEHYTASESDSVYFGSGEEYAQLPGL